MIRGSGGEAHVGKSKAKATERSGPKVPARVQDRAAELGLYVLAEQVGRGPRWLVYDGATGLPLLTWRPITGRWTRGTVQGQAYAWRQVLGLAARFRAGKEGQGTMRQQQARTFAGWRKVDGQWQAVVEAPSSSACYQLLLAHVRQLSAPPLATAVLPAGEHPDGRAGLVLTQGLVTALERAAEGQASGEPGVSPEGDSSSR